MCKPLRLNIGDPIVPHKSQFHQSLSLRWGFQALTSGSRSLSVFVFILLEKMMKTFYTLHTVIWEYLDYMYICMILSMITTNPVRRKTNSEMAELSLVISFMARYRSNIPKFIKISVAYCATLLGLIVLHII